MLCTYNHIFHIGDRLLLMGKTGTVIYRLFQLYELIIQALTLAISACSFFRCFLRASLELHLYSQRSHEMFFSFTLRKSGCMRFMWSHNADLDEKILLQSSQSGSFIFIQYTKRQIHSIFCKKSFDHVYTRYANRMYEIYRRGDEMYD